MLKDKHIAVIGGDKRQLEIAKQVTKLGGKVSLIGFESVENTFFNLEQVAWDTLDGILLPVTGTNDKGEIPTSFRKRQFILKPEYLHLTPEHCTIYTGVSNDYLEACAKIANRKLIRLLDRDDVAIYNSIPTAEGAVYTVIGNTDITIHSANIVVLGFGRVGMTVARTFANLGGKVKVGVRKQAQIARIREMGMEGFHVSTLALQVDKADICVNTIPHLVITKEVIDNMPEEIFIVDLASRPGGTDFTYANKVEKKAIIASNLPGKVASKTAGIILANALIEQMKGGEKNE